MIFWSFAKKFWTQIVNENLLYIHIPKTAGQAFGEFLLRHIGPNNCSPDISRIKFNAALSRYKRLRLIYGHLYPEIGDKLPTDRVSMVILRQPIDRFISDFSFVRSSVVDIPAAKKYVDMSLEEYVVNLSLNDMPDLNLQTMMLWPLGASDFSSDWNFRITCAKQTLDEINFVGVQSDLDDFSAMVAGRFDWPFEDGIRKVNVTRKRSEFEYLPRELQKKMEELLAPDIELYEYAKNIFLHERRKLLCRPWKGGGEKYLESNKELVLPDLVRIENTVTNSPLIDAERVVSIHSIKISGDLSATPQILTGEFVTITIDFELRSFIENLTIGFGISEKDGSAVFASNTALQGYSYKAQPGRYCFTLRFFNRLGEGDYCFGVRFHQSESHYEGLNESFGDLLHFNVADNSGGYFEGRFLLNVMPSLAPISDDILLTAYHLNSNHLNIHVLGRVNAGLSEFRCTINPLDKIINIKNSTPLTLPVELINTSGVPWPSEGKKAVFLSYHWINRDGSLLIKDGIRTPLPRDLLPGEKVIVNAQCLTPNTVGVVQLVWDMVQEHVTWFGDIDSSNLVSSIVEISG